MPGDEIDRAIADEQLHVLVLERALLPAKRHLTVAEVAAESGVADEVILRFRRALGLPDVAPDEPAFTEFDVEALQGTTTLMRLSLASLDSALQLARVIGSSMARIAEAEVENSPVLHGELTSIEAAELYIMTAEYTLPATARILEYAWRRHMQEAMRRAAMLARASLRDPVLLAIGFADMVGFTALSQQLSEEALAEVVDRFEGLAYDIVARCGGRVIKMIGDEVMFTAVEPKVAAQIALTLAEAYADDEMLSDVRVGLAYGPVLLRDGDVYGPVVNLAHRSVNIAAEGSVLTSEEFHRALEADQDFEWRSMRARYLKGIGRVSLWVLRRPGAPTTAASRRDERRARWMVKEAVRQTAERSGRRHGREADGAVEPAGGAAGAPPGC